MDSVEAAVGELGDEVLASVAWLEVSWEEPRMADPDEEFWWSPTWQAMESTMAGLGFEEAES